ncbi:MAG: SH3 domain-containing protein [Candidatus Acidiferrales bacterium]
MFSAPVIPTLLRRFVTGVLAFAIIFATFAASTSAQIYHDPRRKNLVGFSVDLNSPPEAVAKIVQQVAGDTIIRGTFIYAKEREIDDAEAATTSKAFQDAPGSGQVFYKIKTKAISPAHFPGSSDVGTVTVRYIVETVTPQRARLRIDAIFIADAEKTRYPSDGTVETAEYAEIMTQVKALDPVTGTRRRPAQASPVQQSAGLQNTLAEEETRLADAKAMEQKLQDRVKKLQFDTMGLVKSAGVPLKASPYDHSATILTLNKGANVTVLTTTKYWYRIRTPKGDEGWIYYAFLEPIS